jgi:hypothetical protein
MKNINIKFVLSAICLASFLPGLTKVNAAPVQFNEVIQFVSAKPGKASTGSFSQLSFATDDTGDVVSQDDDDKKKRVITTTSTDIVQDQENCDCVEEDVITKKRGFPYWALLGLAAIPIAIILIKRKKDTPTPTVTPSIPITQTPTVTPSITVTPTPPTVTPTPPEPVPEPMTILLFGTGLAGIGMAARKRFGKKENKEEGEE